MIQTVLKINDKPYLIYVENGEYKMTNKENFYARIQNAFEITTFQGFTNIDDVVNYIKQLSPNAVEL